MAMLFGFGQSADISIKLDNEESRKTARIRGEEGAIETHFLYYDGETISGTVNIALKKANQKLEHQGIRIEFIGQIEVYYDRGNQHDFISLKTELARPGELMQNVTYQFAFNNVEKPYESYMGSNVKLRYFLRVTIVRRITDITRDLDIIVHALSAYPNTDSNIKMEVGIEDCLHIEFEYNKNQYHLKDVIVGKIWVENVADCNRDSRLSEGNYTMFTAFVLTDSICRSFTGIGGLSWVVPKKAFLTLDNTLYRAYMRLCLFVFENVSGVQLRLYGDVDQLRSKPESALVLANHQSNVDWAVLVMLAARQGENGSDAGYRVMVKQAIHYVPLFGWYVFQHGYIYVRRFGGFVGGPVLKQLNWLDNLNEKFWLLVFPEGTRFSLRHEDKIDASRAYSRKLGRRVLDHVLCPKSGGVQMALEQLSSLDAVYDVTIAYGQTRLPGRHALAPGMFDFVCGPLHDRSLSVHVKRYPVADLPKQKEELKEWVLQRYEEKDRMLAAYYETGELPDAVSLSEPAVSTLRTLPPTVFFPAALAAPFFSSTVRQAYVYTIATFPLLILWLNVRKCV